MVKCSRLLLFGISCSLGIILRWQRRKTEEGILFCTTFPYTKFYQRPVGYQGYIITYLVNEAETGYLVIIHFPNGSRYFLSGDMFKFQLWQSQLKRLAQDIINICIVSMWIGSVCSEYFY